MGLRSIWNRITRPPAKNPTAQWVEDPVGPLVYSFDDNSLNGSKMGSSFQELSFLGPVDTYQTDGDWGLLYPGKGISLSINGESWRCIVICITRMIPDSHNFLPYSGLFIHKDEHVDVSDLDTRSKWIDHFGAPDSEDTDENETIMYYQFDGNLKWEVEVELNGNVKCVIVYIETT